MRKLRRSRLRLGWCARPYLQSAPSHFLRAGIVVLTIVVDFWISSASLNRTSNDFVVEGVYKKNPLIKLAVTANASHVRNNDFQRSGGDPAAANKVWELS